MKPGKLDAASMALAALMAAWLPALGVSLWLASCADPSAAAGPTGPEKAVTGEWAAPYPDAAAPAGLVLMSLAADKSYQVTIEAAGVPVQRERGAWLLRASRVVFSPATCEEADQAGAPLHLVACTGADSISAAAAADTWPVSFTAGGQLLQLTFRRL